MVENTEFSHGYHYGDYSGVVFYGPPQEYLWLGRLAISNCYINPIFNGILDRESRKTGGDQIPVLVKEWLTLTGWKGERQVLIPTNDAVEFSTALGELEPGDLSQHCLGCTLEECLRCVIAIREFIDDRLTRGVDIYIEDN